MRPISFHVGRWEAWSAERPDHAAWLRWACVDEAEPDREAPIRPPMLLRRRVSALGQQALQAAWGVQQGCRMPLVLASRNGELDRTLSIMRSLAENAPVSPADFSLSVHHALVGLLSIASENRNSHVAVAGGRDSLWLGLVEAVAMLPEAPEGAVLLIYYDSDLPAPYDRFSARNDETIACALEIRAAAPGRALQLAFGPASSAVPEARPGECLMQVLLGGGAVRLRGEMQSWHLACADALA
jgi:hypothetical protein